MPNENIGLSEWLQTWFIANARELPWRDTQDPYAIWVSEVILQQTRVAQGLPYYLRFMAAFPTISTLAQASEERVLALWQGLGYYSRGRNMLRAATQINQDFGGQMPASSTELLKIKGIGLYTAAAVASFGFGERIAVADGNVFRVLSRIFAVADDITKLSTQASLRKLAYEILPAQSGRVAIHNQAIMELGALVCTPKKPKCSICPIQSFCRAYAQNTVEQFPYKSKKKEKTNRYFNYLIISKGTQIALQRRPAGDIWQGLYDFWLCEQHSPVGFESFCGADLPAELPLPSPIYIQPASATFRHQLTHQTLFIRFWKLELPLDFDEISFDNQYTFYSLDQIEKLPKPIVIKNYLQSLEFIGIFSTIL